MLLRLLVTCATAFGCGRIGFGIAGENGDSGNLGDDGGGGGEGGGGPDTAFGNCWAAWRNGTVRFAPPRALTELNDASLTDGDPFVSTDGLTLYFANGPSATRDIYAATRPDRVSLFGTPMSRGDLNSAMAEDKISITSNELLVAFSSDRTGSQGFDLWESARVTSTATFQTADQMPFAMVNTAANERDPHINTDGNRVYFAVGTPQAILETSRTSQVAPFSAPTPVAGLGVAITADPSLSPDELVIVYTGAPNMTTPGHLYYATRAAIGNAFGNSKLLPDVSSTVADGDPHVTADGCELFFASDRSGVRDLYVAPVH